ncbi:glycosyltransferase family 2 protein [Ottowia testudinis]|nr:glycosyltransferase family 2 protein [Ottowia testudinis]
MTAPLIDVLLATYNGARYLAPQLDSLLGQTHQHFRLLVSDDGSTDATLDILHGYRAAFGERLVLLPNPSTGAGVVRNFERLMHASLADGQARWAASCDQDDVWLPGKLAAQGAEMQRIESQAGAQTPCLVHGDLTVVNERLQVISPSFAAYQRTDPAAATALSLLSVNQVTGCAMMVNRTLLRMALPLPPEAIMHDWWCALISGSGRRSYLPRPLLLYRQHGANQVGARDRGLRSRLLRLGRDGAGVALRVRRLGQGTQAQAQALQQRLRALGLDDAYVARYLAWRKMPLPRRLAAYRNYYVGPELDRLSRCLLWHERS